MIKINWNIQWSLVPIMILLLIALAVPIHLYTEVTTYSETINYGVASGGDYEDTWVDDGTVRSINEFPNGGGNQLVNVSYWFNFTTAQSENDIQNITYVVNLWYNTTGAVLTGSIYNFTSGVFQLITYSPCPNSDNTPVPILFCNDTASCSDFVNNTDKVNNYLIVNLFTTRSSASATNGLMNDYQIMNVSFFDTENPVPTIEHPPDEDPPHDMNNFTNDFNSSIADNVEVDAAWYNITNTSNPTQIFEEGTLGDSYDYNWTALGNATDGNYTYGVCANDTSGNIGCSQVDFIVDNTNPFIDFTKPSEDNITDTGMTSITLDGTVTDTNLYAYRINITQSNTSGVVVFNYTIYNITNDTYTEGNTVDLKDYEDGWFYVTVTAEDDHTNRKIPELKAKLKEVEIHKGRPRGSKRNYSTTQYIINETNTTVLTETIGKWSGQQFLPLETGINTTVEFVDEKVFRTTYKWKVPEDQEKFTVRLETDDLMSRSFITNITGHFVFSHYYKDFDNVTDPNHPDLQTEVWQNNKTSWYVKIWSENWTENETVTIKTYSLGGLNSITENYMFRKAVGWAGADMIAQNMTVNGTSSEIVTTLDINVTINVTNANPTFGGLDAWTPNISLWHATSTSADISSWLEYRGGGAATPGYANAVGDLDGDGDPDVAVGDSSLWVKTWESNGKINATDWTMHKKDSGGSATISIAIADMDGDGDSDIIGGNYNDILSIYSSDGSANISKYTKYDATPYGRPFDIAVGDIDGDGFTDIATGDTSKNLSIWYNNGSADISGWTRYDVGCAGHVYSVGIADFNNDGYNDIVTGTTGGNLTIWNNSGTDMDIRKWNNYNGTATTGKTIWALAVGDIDKDGYIDIVTGDHDKTVAVWENDETLLLHNWNNYNGTMSSNLREVRIGDLDSDGDNDVLAGGYDKNLTVFENSGNINITDWIKYNATAAGRTDHINIADIDDDGDNDMILSGSNTNIGIWNNSATTMTQINSSTAVTFTNATKEVATYNFTWTPASAGTYYISAVVDIAERYAEILLPNNRLVVSVDVGDTIAPIIENATRNSGDRTNETAAFIVDVYEESTVTVYFESDYDNPGTFTNYTATYQSGNTYFYNTSADKGTYQWRFCAVDIGGNEACESSYHNWIVNPWTSGGHRGGTRPPKVIVPTGMNETNCTNEFDDDNDGLVDCDDLDCAGLKICKQPPTIDKDVFAKINKTVLLFLLFIIGISLMVVFL